ncbi:MAG: hypothetical protein OEZ01_13790 [Candidatus Heimdallarchaeota archaeon]|nr:hypothetical protein [Candidatus Heimdallarchaeota archaeon]
MADFKNFKNNNIGAYNEFYGVDLKGCMGEESEDRKYSPDPPPTL